jgi:acetolactate synthase small subunit
MNPNVEQIKKNVDALVDSLKALQDEMKKFSEKQIEILKQAELQYPDPNDLPDNLKLVLMESRMKQVDALEGIACFYAFIETHQDGVQNFHDKLSQIKDVMLKESGMSMFDRIKFKMGL